MDLDGIFLVQAMHACLGQMGIPMLQTRQEAETCTSTSVFILPNDLEQRLFPMTTGLSTGCDVAYLGPQPSPCCHLLSCWL